MKRRVVKISGGAIQFLLDDKMQALAKLGKVEASRASHVEPEVINGEVKWFADLSPVRGPKLGPFDTRTIALDKEVAWLNENYLGVKSTYTDDGIVDCDGDDTE